MTFNPENSLTSLNYQYQTEFYKLASWGISENEMTEFEWPQYSKLTSNDCDFRDIINLYS